ncbi:class I SAM-dependent methyltransferase [Paenibacillus alba]|uniref:Class I SAM-dependent methyltransferase n=1 Tax=Paenibacillus alba TaxID=1197127 RepID=A0ABU6GAZ9_9BACL|nr:class I SAM-dependent methyltransferase [Paenibacillus alba]MEC0231367.1 class I SAM-dependent methyltransferase [Paenibacillus alba]
MDEVIQYYSRFDEWGRLDREPVEFMVNWHYIRSFLPQKGHILDNGAGPGKYAAALAQCGYEVTLTDLTPKLVEMASAQMSELNLAAQFNGFHIADARNLKMLEDEQFDASLMLGPLRHIMTSLAAPQHWKPNDKMNAIKAFSQTGTFNHADEGRLTGAYFYEIDEIKPFMESHGFQSLKLIGSSSIAGAFKSEQFDYWRSQGEEEFNEMLDTIYAMAESPYVLGVSSHLMYIGRKL